MNDDLKSDILTQSAFDAATIATDTTTAGNVIDCQGYESLTFDSSIGVWTDGSYTPLIEESDASGSGFTAVADDFLIGTEAAAALTASNTHSRIGYVGKKRYVKFSFVSATTSTGATCCTSSAILGSPKSAPVA